MRSAEQRSRGFAHKMSRYALNYFIGNKSKVAVVTASDKNDAFDKARQLLRKAGLVGASLSQGSSRVASILDLSKASLKDEESKAYGEVEETDREPPNPYSTEAREAEDDDADYDPGDFETAYIEAALWTTVDDDGEPFDRSYSAGDISPADLMKAFADCKRFRQQNKTELSALSAGAAGHDFWLTRNRHGAGFWDRSELPELVQKRLTRMAHQFGEVSLYEGDDGKLYFSK